MSFDWNEYFTLAGQLNVPGNEAKLRSAISRGYYCAFNLAKDYLIQKIGNFKYTNHEEMWDKFGVIPDKVSIESWGNRIRRIRNDADYEAEFPKLSIQSREAIMKVQYIINELKKPSPPEASK